VKLFETTDGLVLCETHFREAFLEMVTPHQRRERDGEGRELAMDEVTRSVLKPRCGMCNQLPSPGRTCERCTTPLHALWPACYCSNECAYEDA
jgi:hypothetical protein